MGPPLDGGGDGHHRDDGQPSLPASMGPPLDGGGDRRPSTRWRVAHGVTEPLASMGPPLDGGGDRGRAGLVVGLLVRFNGAAARWRRRPRRPAAEDRPRKLALQWGRRSMAAETSRSPRPPASPRGFNGAAARWRRNTPNGAASARGGDALQWGRRSMAAETLPRPGAVRLRARRLQWGRRSMAAETLRPVAAGGSSASGLQWGRRSMAAETPSRRAARADVACFNGAAARWRRRLHGSPAPLRRSSVPPLQWGRRSMAAETWMRFW